MDSVASWSERSGVAKRCRLGQIAKGGATTPEELATDTIPLGGIFLPLRFYIYDYLFGQCTALWVYLSNTRESKS